MIGKIISVMGGVAIFVMLAYVLTSNNSPASAPSSDERQAEYEDYARFTTTHDEYYYEELAYDHWDEVKEYISGTETIEACSDSGCYSLDADITDGYIETLHFPNGGYIYPDAEIDDSGFAEGYDYEGNYWKFQIDMGSSMVQDAISEWATDYAESREDYENNYRY